MNVTLWVGAAFERVGIDYFLGGSFASSLQGEPRATNDLDFVVDLQVGQIPGLVEELGADFEVDDEALAEAVRTRSSWNIFYLPAILKIDLFVRKRAPFDDSEFSRRRSVEVRPGQRLYVKTPEDTVLRKLRWFRDGGETSSTQWRDVVQVLRISGPGMDTSYLIEWAATLGLSDLLEKARTEAGASSEE